MIDLKELRRIALAATPGEWEIGLSNKHVGHIVVKTGDWDGSYRRIADVHCDGRRKDRSNENYLMAFSPLQALALIDELERCREALSTAQLVIRSRYAAERELRATLELIHNAAFSDVQAIARKALKEDK